MKMKTIILALLPILMLTVLPISAAQMDAAAGDTERFSRQELWIMVKALLNQGFKDKYSILRKVQDRIGRFPIEKTSAKDPVRFKPATEETDWYSIITIPSLISKKDREDLYKYVDASSREREENKNRSYLDGIENAIANYLGDLLRHYSRVEPASKEDCKAILGYLKELNSELYTLMAQNDPTGQRYIKSSQKEHEICVNLAEDSLPRIKINFDDLRKKSPDDVRCILAHELSHFTGGDLAANFFLEHKVFYKKLNSDGDDKNRQFIQRFINADRRQREYAADRNTVLDFFPTVEGIKLFVNALIKSDGIVEKSSVDLPSRETFMSNHPSISDRVAAIRGLEREIELIGVGSSIKRAPIDWEELQSMYIHNR